VRPSRWCPPSAGPDPAAAGSLRHLGTCRPAPGVPAGRRWSPFMRMACWTACDPSGGPRTSAVPREEQWRIVHWDNDAGAMLLPVATARDLVDAVADHTPWTKYAAQAPEVAPSRRRRAGSAGVAPALPQDRHRRRRRGCRGPTAARRTAPHHPSRQQCSPGARASRPILQPASGAAASNRVPQPGPASRWCARQQPPPPPTALVARHPPRPAQAA